MFVNRSQAISKTSKSASWAQGRWYGSAFITLRVLIISSKEHVAVGSILARLDENFLVDYPITRSKAVTTWFPVTEEIRKLSFYHRLVIEPSPMDADAEYFLAATWLVRKVRY